MFRRWKNRIVARCELLDDALDVFPDDWPCSVADHNDARYSACPCVCDPIPYALTEAAA